MNIKINGVEYSVENATTVFEAASEAGVAERAHIAASLNGKTVAMTAR